ncbi:hypothetical protein [Bacillus toyonensis]|uniref:Uncharacterized protein n=1 Tax=Bacillus toyonensis TaxID=155322 RepID=A0A2C4QZB4_9BACI|nr:hypothetical protein [Bacillus toyonensis]PHD69871.1 hypothetical protein COF40_14350 [Bacillus toyonensis]
MKRQNVHSAISALTTIFYGHKDKELGIKTLEFYIDNGLLNDKELLAVIFEQTQCYDLLNVIRLFDDLAARRIEDILRGV